MPMPPTSIVILALEAIRGTPHCSRGLSHGVHEQSLMEEREIRIGFTPPYVNKKYNEEILTASER